MSTRPSTGIDLALGDKLATAAFKLFLAKLRHAPVRDGRRIVGPVWFAYARGQLTSRETLERIASGPTNFMGRLR